MRYRYETLVDLQARTAALFSEAPLFGIESDGGFRWTTYREFGGMVDAWRARLRELGVNKGSVVALLAPNSPAWAASACAVLGLGGVLVPLSPDADESTWTTVMEHSGAQLLLVADNCDARMPRCAQVCALDQPVNSYEGADVPICKVERDDVAVILYTSSTTERPKGVMLSHGNVAANINALHQIHQFSRTDVSCSCLPWTHAYGFTCELFGMMAAGAAIGVSRHWSHPDHAAALVNDLQAVRPTVLFAVPALWNGMYRRLQLQLADASPAKRVLFGRALAVARRRADARANGERAVRLEAAHRMYTALLFDELRAFYGGRLRFGFSGGRPLSSVVAQLIADVGITIFEGYGLTEASPVVTSNTLDAARHATAGRPLPGVDVFVCDRDGRLLPAGKEGEVVVVGPNVMLGYHRDQAATDAAIFELDGLRALRTGDLGSQSPGGFLSVRGRIAPRGKHADRRGLAPKSMQERI